MMRIHSMKGVTKKCKIEVLKAPPYLFIPLTKEFGNSPEPLVNIGDKVKKYQLIGKTAEGFSASIHSPVSGTVKDIKEFTQAGGKKALTVVIENDFKETKTQRKIKDHTLYSPDELLKIIEDAGIVGEGGAQFPTAKKYNLDGKKIKTFIVNGAECEPYLTADYAIMAERTEELFKGISIINKILHAEEIVIGLEEAYETLKEKFAPFLKQDEYKNVHIKFVSNEYPQGGELQLTRSVTGIERAKSTLAVDFGVIMNNVGTVYAVYEAVVKGKPLIERVITVSGELSKYYGNYKVKIGTPVKHILETTGLPDKDAVVVVGGPMMGKYVTDLSSPVLKGSGGVLLLPEKKVKRLNCIGCGYCVEVCPMFLMPFKYEEIYRTKKFKRLKKYNLDDCIECASCEYVCPCKVPLMESIQKGKSILKEMKDDTK